MLIPKAYYCFLIKYVIFGVYFQMMPRSSSMGSQATKVVTKHHEEFNPADGETMIDEIVYGGIRDMVVKSTVTVTANNQQLPIQFYSAAYKLYKGLRYSAVRIASVAMLWTPTAINFEGYVTVMAMDERFTSDRMSKISLKKATHDMIAGKLIGAVTFDPNFQQLVFGSLNFATAVQDIDTVKFYLMFENLNMPKSVAGFMTLSWKTVGSNGEVYNEVQWDVFKFPRRDVQEVYSKSGKSMFEQLKLGMKTQYDEQKKKMESLDKLRFQLTHATDGGLSKMNEAANSYTIELGKLVVDSHKHEKAIAADEKRKILVGLINKFREAMNSRNADQIKAIRAEVLETCKSKNYELPIEFGSLDAGSGSGVVQFGIPAADE
uniref:p4 n=1 Tax=Emaravirus cercidis TaxID=1980432 RepID=G3G8C8_9VIRU|nr:p4 [Emaravirus cercidis]